MPEQTFQFVLLAATVVGAVLAALVGKLLDASRTNERFLGIWVQPECDALDLSDRNILLKPVNSSIHLSRLFEKQIIIANVGQMIIENVEVVIKSKYSKEFDQASDFVDFRVTTKPEGIKHSFENHINGLVETEVWLKIPFLNSGDEFHFTYLSSAIVDAEVLAHMKNVTVVYQATPGMIPTAREKIAHLLTEKHGIEVLVGLLGAAVSAGVGFLV